MPKSYRYHILVKNGSKERDEGAADNALQAKLKLISVIHKTVLSTDVSFRIVVKEYEID
jgi:hypothetical protein